MTRRDRLSANRVTADKQGVSRRLLLLLGLLLVALVVAVVVVVWFLNFVGSQN